MSQIPFPGGAADQDVFFHEDKVCVYHKAINTWECRTVERGIASGQPEAVTTRTVYTIPIPIDGNEKVLPSPRDLPDLRTQYDVNWYLTDQIVKKARPPIISASPPTNHPQYPTAELEEGDLWIDPNHIMYYWNDDEWVEVKDSLYYQQDRFDDRYVNTDGDTMTGSLELNNARRLYLNNTKVETRVRKESLKDGNGDPILDNGDEQWDDNEERFATIESLPPHLIKSDGSFAADTSTPFGINIEIDDGNTYKHQFKVGNRNGDIVTIAGGTGPEINLGKDFPGNQDPQTGDPHWVDGQEGGVKITGIPTPTFEHPDSSLAVNKGYVDTRDEELRQGIIELAEEIDAIAPSLERGKWRFTAVGTVSNPGQFTMYDDAFGSGQPTGLFKSAKSIWFNAVDNDGVTHAFGDVDDGELLEIFIEGSPEYGLYEVVGQAHDETLGATSFWVIDVNFVRTNEDTTAVAPNEVCRFKVFMAPEGGTADGFVLKTGDTMEGPSPLVFKTKETSSNYNNPPANTSYLKFLNDKNGSITSGSLWFGGNNNILTTDLGLMVRGAIYTKEYYYAYGTSSTSSPRIRLQSSTGSLQSGSTVALGWDSTGVTKIRAKGSEGSSGYVLRLDSNKVPYWSSPPMPSYTISKSNGNYYVS